MFKHVDGGGPAMTRSASSSLLGSSSGGHPTALSPVAQDEGFDEFVSALFAALGGSSDGLLPEPVDVATLVEHNAAGMELAPLLLAPVNGGSPSFHDSYSGSPVTRESPANVRPNELLSIGPTQQPSSQSAAVGSASTMVGSATASRQRWVRTLEELRNALAPIVIDTSTSGPHGGGHADDDEMFHGASDGPLIMVRGASVSSQPGGAGTAGGGRARSGSHVSFFAAATDVRFTNRLRNAVVPPPSMMMSATSIAGIDRTTSFTAPRSDAAFLGRAPDGGSFGNASATSVAAGDSAVATAAVEGVGAVPGRRVRSTTIRATNRGQLGLPPDDGTSEASRILKRRLDRALDESRKKRAEKYAEQMGPIFGVEQAGGGASAANAATNSAGAANVESTSTHDLRKLAAEPDTAAAQRPNATPWARSDPLKHIYASNGTWLDPDDVLKPNSKRPPSKPPVTPTMVLREALRLKKLDESVAEFYASLPGRVAALGSKSEAVRASLKRPQSAQSHRGILRPAALGSVSPSPKPLGGVVPPLHLHAEFTTPDQGAPSPSAAFEGTGALRSGVSATAMTSIHRMRTAYGLSNGEASPLLGTAIAVTSAARSSALVEIYCDFFNPLCIPRCRLESFTSMHTAVQFFAKVAAPLPPGYAVVGLSTVDEPKRDLHSLGELLAQSALQIRVRFVGVVGEEEMSL